MTHPEAVLNHLVETKWVTLREAQQKLFVPRRGRTHLVLWQEVKQAFGGWDLTVTLLSVGKGRQVKLGAPEGLPGESHQRFRAAVPPPLLRTERCLWCERVCSSVYPGHYGTERSLGASLQLCSASTATATAPALFAGFEAKQNLSVAEDGVRMFVKRDLCLWEGTR